MTDAEFVYQSFLAWMTKAREIRDMFIAADYRVPNEIESALAIENGLLDVPAQGREGK